MHPLANDSTVPECLRAAFARVRFQVVATMSDGKETIVNAMSRATVDAKLAEYADIQRVHAARGYGFSDGRTIVSVAVRDVA